jgi:hypothetical protein
VNDPVHGILLPFTYFGPISYYRWILKAQLITLDLHEHYIKQTYRNRCRIAAANGPLDLIIPVEKVLGNHTPMKDIRIAHNQKWQINHWRAIKSAYNNSPYFMYYESELESFFHKRFITLTDFNLAIMKVVLHLIGVTKMLHVSDKYVEKPERDILDLREEFSPKKVSETNFAEYTQVFSEKWDFFQDLSILDLLFNLGPSAKFYLSE